MFVIELQKLCVYFQTLHPGHSFLAKRIIADTACDDAFIAQHRGHVGEIGGGASQLPTCGKDVPQKFTEADDFVAGLHRQILKREGRKEKP